MVAPWNFIASYIDTALWTSSDDHDVPLSQTCDISDLAPETRRRMEADCHSFYDASHRHIHCLGAPLAQGFEGTVHDREAAMAGHDFWLNRCGHGAGFWDGDWPSPHSNALDDAARAFGNFDLYVGDDGRIHAFPPA